MANVQKPLAITAPATKAALPSILESTSNKQVAKDGKVVNVTTTTFSVKGKDAQCSHNTKINGNEVQCSGRVMKRSTDKERLMHALQHGLCGSCTTTALKPKADKCHADVKGNQCKKGISSKGDGEYCATHQLHKDAGRVVKDHVSSAVVVVA